MTYLRPNIEAMSGYVWGEQPSDTKTIKLNTNENPYPPSPEVQRALDGLSVSSLRRYPNPTAEPVRARLAELHGLPDDHFLVTNGGDEAIRLLLTTFVDPGEIFATTQPSYSLYETMADIQAARTLYLPLEADFALPSDFASRVNTAGAKLTAIVNPHAPSGRLFSREQLQDIASELDGLLLIDEAYVDFVEPARQHNCIALVQACPNVVILRSFSKGYGLAGLRLGYLVAAPDLVDPIMWKTRDSYNVDHISQQLGLAALNDQDYASETWRKVRAERVRLAAALEALQLPCFASETNFLLARTASKEHAYEIYSHLKEGGVLVRHFGDANLRITIGTPEENDKLIALLQKEKP